MLPTGLPKLDEFLLGGIPSGAITDIFGSNGTGKTQFLFQLSCNAMKNNNQILYIDTSGQFRPERITEIQRLNNAPNLLDRITVLRVTNTSEQIRSLQLMDDYDFNLVLVDNVTDLFSYEYQNGNQTYEKNLLFMHYMHGLSSYAVDKKIPIIVTNMVRHLADNEVENMQTTIDLFTHIKINLSENLHQLTCKASWLQNRLSFSYKIKARGLLDSDEVI